ncbi:hypothetical protein UFOVP226_3 [uncultured Caudovirales phage]|uniref:Uncharacterized protein n=1 Tax=uncultured Caudovirales phage TaxID=2100421 RepID=A0A6J7WS06_9CAUD|nr:hypothetical protein UFOVP226_3 [uncultured Caudovirales phage]
MSDQLDLFGAHARATDPQTSHEAARTVNVTRGQQIVLNEFLMYHEMTDEQLIQALKIRMGSCPDAKLSDSGARSRRAELVAIGILKDTKKTTTTASGRRTTVWGLNA